MVRIRDTIGRQSELIRRPSHGRRGEGAKRLMKEQVQAALDKIRPALQADGGDVELVDVEGGVVKVRLVGACRGCPMSQLTLANGVERVLKQEIPEVERVESV
jgi:Fe-S cluster biogenesis protein NfuA